MPAPGTYTAKNFRETIETAFPDLRIYHQTSISNIESILDDGVIYSAATRWGLSVSTYYGLTAKTDGQAKGLKESADHGFIDYIFTSPINNLTLSGKQSRKWGTVVFEIDKTILFERESFIFPKSIRWGFDTNFKPWEKASDASMWMEIIGATLPRYRNRQVLIRRKIELAKYLKKIHCFNTYGDRITDLLSKRSLNYSVDSSYEPPSAESKEYDVQASINNMVFQARYCDAEKKTVRLYDPVDGDYEDYHGEYEVDSKGQILEDVAFQKAKVVIGQLIGMDQEATGTC